MDDAPREPGLGLRPAWCPLRQATGPHQQQSRGWPPGAFCMPPPACLPASWRGPQVPGSLLWGFRRTAPCWPRRFSGLLCGSAQLPGAQGRRLSFIPGEGGSSWGAPDEQVAPGDEGKGCRTRVSRRPQSRAFRGLRGAGAAKSASRAPQPASSVPGLLPACPGLSPCESA